eukprot:GFYU01008628.1.p1 GENE.GFYU01008628.1~~GFYU01008628.1.p1  ORF type:complete len:121 (-),score=24.57 GFYU01008628.1:107-469(-)
MSQDTASTRQCATASTTSPVLNHTTQSKGLPKITSTLGKRRRSEAHAPVTATTPRGMNAVDMLAGQGPSTQAYTDPALLDTCVATTEDDAQQPELSFLNFCMAKLAELEPVARRVIARRR